MQTITLVKKNDEKGKALDPAIKNAFALGALYTAGDLDARFAYGHTKS